MKRLKKLLTIGISFLLMLCTSVSLFGCKNIYDYKPKAYGEWEGNYIYRGNYRSKTTGEDCEQLVSEVVYEGITYQLEDYQYYNDGERDRYSYFIHGDFIYLILIGCSKDETVSSKKFLIRYNLREKTQETLFVGNSKGENTFDYISYVNDERIVLEKDDSWIALDFNGNLIVEEFPAVGDTTLLGNEYLIYKNYVDETLVYRTFADSVERKIMDMKYTLNYSYKLIETENQKGIVILNTNDGYGDIIYNYWFFDLETGTLHIIAENFNQKIVWVDENYSYFITYERGLVAYKEKSNSCFGVEEKSFETNLNCKLYAVDYINGSIKEIYVFEPKRNCTQVNILDDGNIYITQVWWEDYQFLKNDGGKVFIRSRFDLESETFTLVDEEEYDRIYDLPKQSEKVVCGEYVYYMKSYFVSLMWGKSSAVELIRMKGEQAESMQFCTSFGEENDLEEGVRGNLKILGNNFIVLPY